MSNTNPVDPTDTMDPGDDFVRLGYFIGTVRNSFWSTPAAESEGKASGDWAMTTRLYWSVDVDDVLQDVDDAPENITVSLTIGKGWYADEAGRHVRHEDAPTDEEIIAAAGKLKPKRFSPSSLFGQVLGNIQGSRTGYSAKGGVRVLDGGPDLEINLSDLGKWFRDHGLRDSRDASIFNGCQFMFRGVGFVYDSDNPKPDADLFMTVVPVALCGVPSGDTAGNGAGTNPVSVSPGPVASPTTGVPASAPTTPQGGFLASLKAAGADEATLTVLAKLSTAASSHAEFAGNALLLPAVKDNEALKAAVATDPGSWN